MRLSNVPKATQLLTDRHRTALEPASIHSRNHTLNYCSTVRLQHKVGSCSVCGEEAGFKLQSAADFYFKGVNQSPGGGADGWQMAWVALNSMLRRVHSTRHVWLATWAGQHLHCLVPRFNHRSPQMTRLTLTAVPQLGKSLTRSFTQQWIKVH